MKVWSSLPLNALLKEGCHVHCDLRVVLLVGGQKAFGRCGRLLVSELLSIMLQWLRSPNAFSFGLLNLRSHLTLLFLFLALAREPLRFFAETFSNYVNVISLFTDAEIVLLFVGTVCIFIILVCQSDVIRLHFHLLVWDDWIVLLCLGQRPRFGDLLAAALCPDGRCILVHVYLLRFQKGFA